MASPGFGSPAYTSPPYAPPVYAPPAYGQPVYGQPQYTQPGYPPPPLPPSAYPPPRYPPTAAAVPQAPLRPREPFHVRLQEEIAVPGRPPAGVRRYRAWVASSPSEDTARREWQRLVSRHPELSQVEADIEQVVNERGEPVWRLHAGRFATTAEASAFCGDIRLADVQARCLPYRDPR